MQCQAVWGRSSLLVECQADVWEFFHQPGLYGQEVVTEGGRRGPARAYYLPSLSAMQLFLPAKAHDGVSAHRPRHQLYSHDADWGPCWSTTFRPLAEMFETVGPVSAVRSLNAIRQVNDNP